MTIHVYQDGTLRQHWDDATRTYRAWNADGSTAIGTPRPYTADENARADAHAAEVAQTSAESTIRTETAASLDNLNAEIIGKTNAELFTQSGVGSALKLLARTLRLVIRLLIRRFDGTT